MAAQSATERRIVESGSTLTSNSERIGIVESELKHMATKADIGDLRLELEKSVNTLQANINALKWVIGIVIGIATIATTIINIVIALLLSGV